MGLVAKLDETDSLKAVIGSVATLVEEATFGATSEGITFKGMDPSHVALIDIQWPNAAFAAYQCDSEVRFGVRVDEFAKLVRRAGKSDGIEISITDDNLLKMTIGRGKVYKMRLIGPASSDAKVPKIGFDAKVVLPYAQLDRILGDVQIMSEFLTISVERDRCVFSGVGDTGEAQVEVESDDENEIDAEQDSKGTYNLDYLLPVVRAVGKASKTISCEFSTSKPLRMGFTISGIGHIHFYIAPRMEN